MVKKSSRPSLKVLKKKSLKRSSRKTHRARSGKKKRPKVIVVLGPNASGKSELGVQLAVMHHGEVVSADSRQVYSGLSIGAGKIPGRWKRVGRRRLFIYKGIPHHMIDLVSPRKTFTAQQYKRKAKRAVGQILNRKRLPIVVGGTGFYIDSLIYDLNFPEVAPQRKLRSELQKLNTDQLLNRLRGLDPHRAEAIDIKNRRRIIRAIEIVVSTGTQVQPLKSKNKKNSPYDVLFIGIKLPEERLKDNINKRLNKRFDGGMIREVERLHKIRRVSWRRLEELGLEYRCIAQHLQGFHTKEEMAELLEKEIRRFAKRQMTWFKKNGDIIWIDAPEKAFPVVQDFLGREGEPSPAQSKT